MEDTNIGTCAAEPVAEETQPQADEAGDAGEAGAEEAKE